MYGLFAVAAVSGGVAVATGYLGWIIVSFIAGAIACGTGAAGMYLFCCKYSENKKKTVVSSGRLRKSAEYINAPAPRPVGA